MRVVVQHIFRNLNRLPFQREPAVVNTHGSTLRTMQEIFGVMPLLNDAATETDLSDLLLFRNALAETLITVVSCGLRADIRFVEN